MFVPAIAEPAQVQVQTLSVLESTNSVEVTDTFVVCYAMRGWRRELSTILTGGSSFKYFAARSQLKREETVRRSRLRVKSRE